MFMHCCTGRVLTHRYLSQFSIRQVMKIALEERGTSYVNYRMIFYETLCFENCKRDSVSQIIQCQQSNWCVRIS